MTAPRKIVINGCGECPISWYCPNADIAMFSRKVDIQNKCPLPQDTQPESPALLQPPRVSDSQLVAVSQTITMLDARDYPPPNGKILCGSARKFGTTVIGRFDASAHDCWLPMPKFPDSLKGRR